MHALGIQDIRPGTVDAGRLVGSVKVKDKAVFCGSLRSPVIESGHQAVIPVHKIDFEALHSHFGVMPAHVFHIPFESGISGPEYDADILRSGIVHYPLHIDFRIYLQQVLPFADSPAVIENHIFDSVRRSKVDVILVSPGVDAGLEIHTVDIPVVPPVPRNLARLYPGYVLYFGRLSKEPYGIALGNTGVGSYDTGPPRESPRSIHTHKEVLIFDDLSLDIVVTSIHDSLRARGKHRLQRILCFPLVEIHTGVIIQVDIGYAELHTLSRIHHKRQESKPSRIESGNRGHGIEIFEGMEKLRPEIAVNPFLDIRKGHGPVLREIVGDLFPADTERLVKSGRETIGHGIIIHPELQRPSALKADNQTVISFS